VTGEGRWPIQDPPERSRAKERKAARGVKKNARNLAKRRNTGHHLEDISRGEVMSSTRLGKVERTRKWPMPEAGALVVQGLKKERREASLIKEKKKTF